MFSQHTGKGYPHASLCQILLNGHRRVFFQIRTLRGLIRRAKFNLELRIFTHSRTRDIDTDLLPVRRDPFDAKGTHIRRLICNAHSFTAPIIIPFTKYFCTNGYAHKTGSDATTITPYLIISAS